MGEMTACDDEKCSIVWFHGCTCMKYQRVDGFAQNTERKRKANLHHFLNYMIYALYYHIMTSKTLYIMTIIIQN